MRHVFLVDPLPGLNVQQDSSVALMREAARRGHELFTAQTDSLGAGEGGRPVAWLAATEVSDADPWYRLGVPRCAPLQEFDVVWMRKDPPYDLNYFYATHLLDLLPPPTLVVNHPMGLREVTEKMFVLRFPEICPESVISRRIDDLLAFRDKLGGEMVIKPLGGCGGEGVFHLRQDDKNVRPILEMATRHGTEYQVGQRYLPEVRQGDKRIILLEGEPIGAVLRVPPPGETRANFHVGGTPARTEITARDREICDRIRPALVEHGIIFAGIDVIGGWLTEINVTSPTGIQEINAFENTALEAQVLDAAERRWQKQQGGGLTTMGIDPSLLRSQCSRTLERTDFPELGERIEGKVRDNYVRDGVRTILATDRISAFDVVVGTLPFKGQVLNQLAAFWFERTREIAPNHLLGVPDPCASVVRECRVLPVEFVYRAYLTGVSKTSIWQAYRQGERLYCGHRLPEGLREHQRLPEPLLTPTTKAEQGGHDQLTSRAELLASGVISEEHYDRAAEIAAALFAEGTRWTESRGLILVDTKYEMGLDPDGNLLVIDEIHTPDSSRYWYRNGYERALREAEDPMALDKEYVRRWLVERGYKGEGPPPALPDDVRCEASRRYIEAYEAITGRGFEPFTEEPIARMRRNILHFFDEKV